MQIISYENNADFNKQSNKLYLLRLCDGAEINRKVIRELGKLLLAINNKKVSNKNTHF
jgi:hypothetical protein